MKFEGNEFKQGDTPPALRDLPLASNHLSGTNYRKSDSSQSKCKQADDKILTDICDNIHSNQSFINRRIRRMFSLEDVLVSPDGKFYEKPVMMEKLIEYDNLIKAIGALQYVSQNITNLVPLCFKGWKDVVFERRANRIMDILSSQDEVSSKMKREVLHVDDEDEGLAEADEDYEEYFFKDQGETDQYVKVIEDT